MSEATPIGSGRYGLLGTLSTTLPRIVRHRGVDTILDRDVTILVLTDATLHRDNVLESASRAVLVEDQRLQQVYDVERAEPSVIVTEPLTGRTFSSLVSRGMSPAQARAIIGETAQALDAGARKGLHHLNPVSRVHPYSSRWDGEGQRPGDRGRRPRSGEPGRRP